MEIKDVFKNKKTDLYGLMASYKDMSIEERSITPIIITDLWDTKSEVMYETKMRIDLSIRIF